MAEINQFLQNLSKNSDVVKKRTRALQHLGITRFYYSFIKPNGEHLLLSDSPQTVEFYYEQQLYNNDPYMRHPDNYKSGFFNIETFKKDGFNASLAHVAQKFKTNPIVGLCEKRDDYVEFFRFWGEGGEKNTFDIANVQYANLLKAFASHFKEECAHIIRPQTEHFFSLKDLVGADLFEATKTPSVNIDAKTVRKYLKEIGLGDYVAKADLLSPREQGCMRLLLKGKSIKEIAAILKLSPRTVEHYLESVKNKFNCQFKNELFSIGEQLYEFGLI